MINYLIYTNYFLLFLVQYAFKSNNSVTKH